MDPLTAANTFATIVSLISIFKSERTASTADENEAFMQWLQTKRYDSVIQEITANHMLALGIKNLLIENHEEVVSAVEALQDIISKLASRLAGFNQIANAISPTVSLSQQALSMLQQLNQSEGSSFLEVKSYCGTTYLIMDGTGGHIDISEPRFAVDDLATLVKLGLLRSALNSDGNRLWMMTREASSLVLQTDKAC